MWFVVLSILLIKTLIFHGSEDSQLALKELHYEISKVAREVQELYVEPDTAQIALDEKAKKTLEEYIPIDISSGLPEQVELLDLKDKAEDVKTSKETRKAVMDGLEYLRNVKEMKNDEKQLSDIVIRLKEAIKVSIRFDKENLEKRLWHFDRSFRDVLRVGELVQRDQKFYEKGLKETLPRLEMKFDGLLDSYLEVATVFERMDIVDHILLGFPEVMKSDIEGGKEKIEEIRKLKEEFDISQKILLVKREIKVMEELRDSEAIQKILDFMEKIKASFESIKGSGLDLFEWKIGYFSQKWIPLQNHLKNLKVPTGDLTEPLTKIEECLQTFDFSMDFSTEETGSLKLEEAFKDFRSKKDNPLIKSFVVEEFKVLGRIIDDMGKWLEKEWKNWDDFEKLIEGFLRNLNLLTKAHEMEEPLTKIHEAFMEFDTVPIQTVTERITSKVSKIKEFLNCSSSLKIVPSEMKSLMDQPKEVWNFDARPLESVLEVVYLFKEAHRFLMDKKQPVPIDGFPLTKEEVTEISDGLGILKTILDYQKLWNEIPLTEELIDSLKIHSNLPAVQFPKDIDSLINFYITQYQGPQRRRILKILEGVKDYSQFPSKLEKMNEAVGKWKNWRKEQNPDEQTVDGEELIDCSERTCELTLPETNPEDSMEKVEL